MRRLAWVFVAMGCRTDAQPLPRSHVAVRASADQPVTVPWVISKPDRLFAVETPVAAQPSDKVPALWTASIGTELSYLFSYLPIADAANELDGLVDAVTSQFLRSSDRIEVVTVSTLPARRIWGTTPRGRPARVLMIAGTERCYVLQVIGEAPDADIERFFRSFQIL